jgi:uncharacterized protein (TIGR02231 family)
MNQSTPWIALLLLSTWIPAWAAGPVEQPVSSTIDAVTVYRERAQLTRTATAPVQRGDNVLIFSGLSQHLLPNSLNVRGEGAGVIQSVRHRVSYLNRAAIPVRVQVLQDSIEGLSQELLVIQDEQFVNQSEEKLLLANQQLAGQQQGLDVETLRQTAALMRERLTAVRRNLRQLQRREEDSQRTLQALRLEINQLRQRRDQPTQEVVVVFQADQPGNLTLTLTYLVGAARWDPFYDLRVSEVGAPIQMALKANVINNTGVDWPQVLVQLATTQNSGNNVAPTLTPQYVYVRPSRPAPRPFDDRATQSRKMTAGKFAGAGNTFDMEEEVLEDQAMGVASSAADYTTTSEGELGLVYDIALRYDLPADGQAHQVDIMQRDLDAAYHHYAVPALDRDVFLVADIREDLLQGPANVYFEGTFVGETRIDTDNPRDSMRLSLGRDPKVQVQREQVKDYTAQQVIGNKVKQTFAYEITVRNLKTQAISLTLQDHMPVSQTKEIEVTPEAWSDAHLDEATGQLSWDLTLAAGEARTLTFRYEVKHPKDTPVVGL